MTRLIFQLLAIIVLFASCNDGRKKVTYQHPEGYYKEIYYLKNDSTKEGRYLKYYANELLADSCQFVNNKIHGERKLFSDKGYLEILENYNHGVFEGPYITYYPDGEMKKNQQYVNNRIQGEVIEYYLTGKIKAISQMVDNIENGPFQEFFENGQLHWEGFYQNGDFEQDTLKEFNIQGLLIRKLFCDNGICQTVWTPEKGYFQPKEIFE